MPILLLGAVPSCADRPAGPSSDLLIIGTEYAFDAPAEAASGTVAVRLRNDGPAELHNVAVIQLAGPRTPADFIDAKASDPTSPPWATHVGGVESIPPGAEAEVILDLRPGPHLLVCYHQLWEAGQTVGQPHFERGMIAPLMVVGEPSDLPLPEEDAVLSMFDYGFTLSRPLKVGTQMLRVIGAGPQDHNVLLWRLGEGRSQTDLIAWLESDRSSPPPAQPLGGMSALSPGRQAYLPLDLAPGRYVFVCLVADEEDLRFHASHGMALEFTVV